MKFALSPSPLPPFFSVSLGAQEIFKLLPHSFVEPSRLPELFGKVSFHSNTPFDSYSGIYPIKGILIFGYLNSFSHLFYTALIKHFHSQGRNLNSPVRTSKRVFQVYGCVVTSRDMVEHKDPSKTFDKVICPICFWFNSFKMISYARILLFDKQSCE